MLCSSKIQFLIKVCLNYAIVELRVNISINKQITFYQTSISLFIVAKTIFVLLNIGIEICMFGIHCVPFIVFQVNIIYSYMYSFHCLHIYIFLLLLISLEYSLWSLFSLFISKLIKFIMQIWRTTFHILLGSTSSNLCINSLQTGKPGACGYAKSQNMRE
jgi:hypothetical protein